MSPSPEVARSDLSIQDPRMKQFEKPLHDLREGEPLSEEELHTLSYFIQNKYIETFFPLKEKAEEQMLQWITEGFASTFRELWSNNGKTLNEEEGFRDLCLQALKEESPQKQRMLFE